MAVSGVTTFNLNRDEIITDALIDIGGLAIGATPTTNQIQHAARRLNTIIKGLQAEHMYLYAKVSDTVDTVGSTATVAYPSGIRRFDNLWITVSGTDKQMTKMTFQEYDDLTNKGVEGVPTHYVIDEAAATITLHPVPDAIYTISYRAETILDDLTTATDNIALPQPALDFIVKELALELAIPYGLPMDRIQIFAPRAMQAKQAFIAHYNQELNPKDTNQPVGVLIT